MTSDFKRITTVLSSYSSVKLFQASGSEAEGGKFLDKHSIKDVRILVNLL